MKVISCSDLLFHDPERIKYHIIHTCYLFVLSLLSFGCIRSKIMWKNSLAMTSIKKKKFRPTNSNIFGHVTGNTHNFFRP